MKVTEQEKLKTTQYRSLNVIIMVQVQHPVPTVTGRYYCYICKRMVCPIIDLTYLGSASVSQDRSDEIADYAFCNGVYIIL